MQAPLLAVRRCTIALTFVLLLVLASYLVPYLADPQVSLWQVLLPPWNTLFAFSRAPLIIVVCIMFMPLLFPLGASWAALRFPLRIMSLVNVRLCLPLISAAWFFWIVLALELYSPASGLQGILHLVLFVPVLGLLLAFGLILLLGRYLRAFQLDESALAVSQTSLEHEQGVSEQAEAAPERVLHRLPFVSLIGLGLLCQLVFLLSLFLPFTDAYDPYRGSTVHVTGWQTLGLSFPLALLLLLLFVLPLLPVIVALLYRVPLLARNIQREVFHRGGVYLGYWFTLICFILSSIVLEYSLLFIGVDDNRAIHWMDVAFGIPVAVFFLALFCSGTLRVFLLRSAETPLG